MNIIAAIISLSLIVQVISVFLAFRLMRLTKSQLAGITIPAAIFLMFLSRSISLYRLITDGATKAGIPEEVICLSVSILFLFGILYVTRLVLSSQRANELLSNSDTRYRTLFAQSPDGILILDTEGHVIEFNEAAHRQLGYTKEEFAKLRLSDIDPFESSEEIQASIEQVLKDGEAEFEVKHMAKDGEIRDVHVITQTIVLSGHQLFYTVWRDITEQKKAEEELDSSRELIKNILDTVDVGFIVIDRDYKIMLTNNAYCKQANMPEGDIIGQPCYKISHQSDKPCYEAGEECAVRYTFEKGLPHTCSHKHYDHDGNIIYVETKSFPLKDASGAVPAVIEVVHNITDRHLLEEQLLRTHKMEAVGLLAGGIAHDFNNLLQGVFGNISMAKTFSENNVRVYQMLENAEKALDLATNLTKQLLTFSKGGEPVKRVISLSAIIQDSVKFALSGSNINYGISVDDNLWPVEADEGQINQVIQNIVINASDAMPHGGTVRIKAENISIGDDNVLPLDKGKYVLISIEDNGVGMPSHNLARIFDPYFTTKKKGNGLGLATSYSIIRKHNGIIDVQSEVGIGSTFFIYLPAAEKKLFSEEQEAVSLMPGKGRILLMDDEEIIRQIAGAMIEALGYEVDFAVTGEEAVEKYSIAMKCGNVFDAVILDLTIRGGMGGKDTIKELVKIDTAVKAIVSSGYSVDSIMEDFDCNDFKAVLTKPYKIELLGKTLQSIIYGSC